MSGREATTGLVLLAFVTNSLWEARTFRRVLDAVTVSIERDVLLTAATPSVLAQ